MGILSASLAFVLIFIIGFGLGCFLMLVMLDHRMNLIHERVNRFRLEILDIIFQHEYFYPPNAKKFSVKKFMKVVDEKFFAFQIEIKDEVRSLDRDILLIRTGAKIKKELS